MRDILEYDEEDFEDELPDDGNDDIRRAIMEAETNEVWLEEPADEEDEEQQIAANPLFAMLSASGGGFPGIPTIVSKREEKENDEDPEQ